ncbi:MAG TPA: PDZ domain-containing protein [Thermoanaerobaculia bacterium]|nr:PDZ domain-containing protein [Thermoanaerobaculia bacterium]
MKKTTIVMLVVAVLMTVSASGADKREMVVIRDGNVMKLDGESMHLFERGFIGVELLNLTPELRSHFGAANGGILVSRVTADGPAAKAGLRVGDLITAIDGVAVDSSNAAGRLIQSKKEGEQVRIDVLRNGARQTLVASAARKELRGARLLLDGDLPSLEMLEAPEIKVAMEKVQTFFDSPEWKARVEKLQDCTRVQQRVRDLESRLADLEKRLQPR